MRWLPPKQDGPGPQPEIAVCPEAHLGMSYSLRRGLSAARAGGAGAVLVVLGDQPFVDAPLLTRLIERYRLAPGLDYVACGNGGAAMPPALMAHTMFAAMDKLEGDKGARGLFADPHYKGDIIEVPDRAVFLDADTEEDMREIRLHWVQLHEQA
ncbi:hypothetical protein VN24_14720 [Paenibacillus beijingensis]|uniref:MobA-like NTP transferase domain-containing protein n=1 Tax=Paenibacillus beijingensis TaxID=1126833 RepID=A0A0D5NR06_9BACL|nr:hypothetical protein VN24_14720 [Paenibacillus beijingensis]